MLLPQLAEGKGQLWLTFILSLPVICLGAKDGIAAGLVAWEGVKGDVEDLLTETLVKSLLSLRQERRPCLLFDATKFCLALDAERP